MRVAHHPVGQVLDELVAEFHLLPEGQVVAACHHGLYQLAQFRLDVYRVHRRIQMPNVTTTTDSFNLINSLNVPNQSIDYQNASSLNRHLNINLTSSIHLN